MKTEEIALERLSTNEDNPRQITSESFARLVRSVLVFPKMLTLRPVVVDETLRVLGGNMRLKALQRCAVMSASEIRQRIREEASVTPEMEEVLAAYWADWQTEPTATVVKACDLTERQKREFIIKDNAAFGQWDMDRLANEWYDVPLSEWGVAEWDTEQEEEDEEHREVHEDNYKDNEEKPRRVNRGEIWQLGEHRLMCGDSTDVEQVRRLTGGETMQLLVTDPPYNINYSGRKHAVRKHIANDSMDADDFVSFLTNAFMAADEVMAEGGAYYIWHAYGNVDKFLAALRNVGWEEKQNLVWYKNHFTLSFADYQWIHEPCIYGWKEGKHYFCKDRNLATVWQDEKPEDYTKLKKSELIELVRKLTSPATPITVLEEAKPGKSDLHPTMKPVRLFASHMQNSSKQGWNVLDLFGGSGTTIIAAEQMERKAYVMEYEEAFCDTIVDRWEQFTGKQAFKVEDAPEQAAEDTEETE